MGPIIGAIAFINWEKSMARELGITWGEMKDLTKTGFIKTDMTVEKAKEVLIERRQAEKRRREEAKNMNKPWWEQE